MRLWSLHPKYLDTKGLVALWREALLAQNVLQGKTGGYGNHSQLIRFKETRNPEGAIASYLKGVHQESVKRGYHFNKAKIANKSYRGKIKVTHGQLQYEVNHLLKKLKNRSPESYMELKRITKFESHPLFVTVSGDIEGWEVVNGR